MSIGRRVVVLALSAVAAGVFGVADARADHEGCQGSLSRPTRGPQPFLVASTMRIYNCRGRVYSSSGRFDMWRNGVPWRTTSTYWGYPSFTSTGLFDCDGTAFYQAHGTFSLSGATGTVWYGIRSLTGTVSCANHPSRIIAMMPVYDDYGTGTWLALPH